MKESKTYTVTIALIDGEQVAYDACSETMKYPTQFRSKVYLGQGTIESLDGVRQFTDEELAELGMSPRRLLHFWRWA